MKKILLISSEFPPGPGGIGTHAADLSLALNKKGFSVNVFSTLDHADNTKVENFISSLPAEIQLFPLKRYGWKTYINRIKVVFHELSKTKYNRIIVTGKFPIWVGALIKMIYGKRQHVDFFVHGSEINPSNFIIRSVTHWSLKKADIIWAVSDFTLSLLPNSLRRKKDIKILPNGIYIDKWKIYRDSLPYSNWQGHPKLLTVGNITARKGQYRVIKALPEITKIYPGAHYHMVGLPTNEKLIFQLAESLQVDKHITLHGWLVDQSELARAYKTADIFMMLSENQPDGDVEGFGIAILEANYWGIPSVGATGCGIADAISAGISGEIADGDNAVQITAAIKKILENNQVYKNNLHEWVQKHNWDTIVEKFIAKH